MRGKEMIMLRNRGIGSVSGCAGLACLLVMLMAGCAASSKERRSGDVSPGQMAAADGALMPCVSFKGPHSAIRKRRCVRITDRESWEALWKEHRGEALETNKLGRPVIPVIDFDRCMVIAIFRGESWNCNGEYVVSVEDRGRDVLLRFDSHSFQTCGPDGGGVRVEPYGIFVLPRTAKPIVIEENVQGMIGRPPNWKVQWAFEAIEE
jgi:hypothetical protein